MSWVLLRVGCLTHGATRSRSSVPFFGRAIAPWRVPGRMGTTLSLWSSLMIWWSLPLLKNLPYLSHGFPHEDQSHNPIHSSLNTPEWKTFALCPTNYHPGLSSSQNLVIRKWLKSATTTVPIIEDGLGRFLNVERRDFVPSRLGDFCKLMNNH